MKLSDMDSTSTLRYIHGHFDFFLYIYLVNFLGKTFFLFVLSIFSRFNAVHTELLCAFSAMKKKELMEIQSAHTVNTI